MYSTCHNTKNIPSLLAKDVEITLTLSSQSYSLSLFIFKDSWFYFLWALKFFLSLLFPWPLFLFRISPSLTITWPLNCLYIHSWHYPQCHMFHNATKRTSQTRQNVSLSHAMCVHSGKSLICIHNLKKTLWNLVPSYVFKLFFPN
jgi:hypothetical protein